jgi:hypothetical protein
MYNAQPKAYLGPARAIQTEQVSALFRSEIQCFALSTDLVDYCADLSVGEANVHWQPKHCQLGCCVNWLGGLIIHFPIGRVTFESRVDFKQSRSARASGTPIFQKGEIADGKDDAVTT